MPTIRTLAIHLATAWRDRELARTEYRPPEPIDLAEDGIRKGLKIAKEIADWSSSTLLIHEKIDAILAGGEVEE